MIIFLIASKIRLKDKKIIATSFYFVIITTILSMKMFYALYATLAVLLGSIIVYYYKNYKQKKSRSSMFVFLAFVFIFISQFFFIFMLYSKQIYVVGEVIQVVGYLLLLIAFIMVFKKK